MLSQYIAIAIRNAEAYHYEFANRRVYEHLQQSVVRLSPDTSLEKVIHGLFDELNWILPWDACGIWLYHNSEADTDMGLFRSSLRLAGFRLSDEFIKNYSGKKYE